MLNCKNVLLVIMLSLIVLTAPVAASAVSLLWKYHYSSDPATVVAQDEYGTYVWFGTAGGNLTSIDATGNYSWNRSFGSSITKLVVSPNGARYLIQTADNHVYYGDGHAAGDIYASWDGIGDKAGDGSSAGGVVDIDLSKDGAYWLVVMPKKLLVQDSANNTIGVHYLNQAGEATGYGTFSKGVIDPAKNYVIATYTGSKYIHRFGVVNAPGPWYQGYNYRTLHTIVGSTAGYLEHWYGVAIVVYNTTGTSSGQAVFLGVNNSYPNFTDVRIIDPNTNDLVQSFISAYGSNYAVINIVYPNISISETKTFYVYYGNTSATPYPNNYTAIVGDDIGALTVPVSVFNWNMEQAGLWTATFAQGHNNDAAAYLPWSGWHSEGSYSLGLHTSANMYATGYVGHCDSESATWTSTVGIPGWNGSSTYSGFGSKVYVDGYSFSSGSGACDPGHGSASSIHSTTISAGTTTLWSLSRNAGTYTDYFTNTPSNVPAGTAIVMSSASTACGDTNYCNAGTTGNSGMDNVTFHRWVDIPPTHGAWGTIETRYNMPYQAATAIDTAPVLIDLPWNFPWLAVSTANSIGTIFVSPTGFSTNYNTSTDSATPYALSITDGASYTAEGRGIVANAYQYGADQVLTYSAGNIITSISVSTSDGLWIVTGSQDGRVYVFSKVGSSTWYFYWGSDAGSVPNAVKVDAHGSYIAVSYANGDIAYYSTNAGAIPTPSVTVAPIYITVHVMKEDAPYPGATLSLYNGLTTGAQYVLAQSGQTDSRGNYVFTATAENYYKATVDGQSIIIYASNTLLDYYLVIHTQMMSATVQYLAVYNPTLNTIDISYTDSAQETSSVNYRIINTNNYTEVYNATNIASPNSISTSWPIPANQSDITYKVELNAHRQTDNIHNIWAIRPSGTMRIPIPLDSLTLNVICVVFLMVVSGLFGRVHSHRGGIVVIGFFLFFIFAGWMTVPWYAAAPLALFAFLYAFVKGAPQ